jgi:anti-anti-sigma regulatory factor
MGSSHVAKLQAVLDFNHRTDDKTLHLDLEPLTYKGSAGLRAPVAAGKCFNKPGMHWGRCAPSVSVRNMLDVSGLDKVIVMCKTPALQPRARSRTRRRHMATCEFTTGTWVLAGCVLADKPLLAASDEHATIITKEEAQ